MMKLVINKSYGGFGLSEAAVRRYAELAGLNIIAVQDQRFNLTHYYLNEVAEKNFWYDRELDRSDPWLVQTVEELGELASDRYATLGIVEIPDGVDWTIEEYDGDEWVAERHRTWR